MEYINNLNLDISGSESYACVTAKQYDKHSRYVKITLYDNNTKYDFSNDVKAKLRARKPDGKSVLNDLIVNDDKSITAELTEQLLAVPGKVKAEISLYQVDGAVLTSCTFIINVVPNAYNPKQIESTHEFNALDSALIKAENSIKLAKSTAEEIKQLAEKGEFNGKDYILTDADKSEIANIATEQVNVDSKLDKQQGVENNGMLLGIDEKGEVKPTLGLTKAYITSASEFPPKQSGRYEIKGSFDISFNEETISVNDGDILLFKTEYYDYYSCILIGRAECYSLSYFDKDYTISHFSDISYLVQDLTMVSSFLDETSITQKPGAFLQCSDAPNELGLPKLQWAKVPSEFETENIAERVIDSQIKNGFEWSDFDKVYLTMTFDDSNSDIDLLENMAEELGVPLCFATIPSRLNNTCTNGETVKEVLTRAVQNGGEVLSHYGKPLTGASTDADYQKVYVETKKLLEKNGFNINGIITAGGADYQTQDFAKATKLARIYYQYADLTATNDKTNRQFYNSRKFTDNGLDATKAYIDSIVANGNGWINLASHGTNNANTSTVSVFQEILEYAQSQGVEIVTWKYLFDKFGKVKNNSAIKSLSVNGEKAEADENGNVNLEVSASATGENWRVICDETLTEDVKFVTKNKDMNGDPFKLKKLKIYITSPANTATSGIGLSTKGNYVLLLSNAITQGIRYTLFDMECDLYLTIRGSTGAPTYGMSSAHATSVSFNYNEITDFTVRAHETGVNLLAGTQIKAWGC